MIEECLKDFEKIQRLYKKNQIFRVLSYLRCDIYMLQAMFAKQLFVDLAFSQVHYL